VKVLSPFTHPPQTKPAVQNVNIFLRM